jgi:hypothetical protein
MATIGFAGSWLSRGVHQTVWSAMGNADNGAPQTPSSLADKTVQFDGTFGGATAVLSGSNDGTSWFTLSQPDGSPISATVSALMQIVENTKYVRPTTSGGAGSSINVRMVERGGSV